MGFRHLPSLPPQDLTSLSTTLNLRLAELEEKVRFIIRVNGTPEGVVSAPIGTIVQRTDGSTSTTLYVKESGTGNTGWVAK